MNTNPTEKEIFYYNEKAIVVDYHIGEIIRHWKVIREYSHSPKKENHEPHFETINRHTKRLFELKEWKE